ARARLRAPDRQRAPVGRAGRPARRPGLPRHQCRPARLGRPRVSGAPVLETRGLVAGHGGVPVVHDLDLTVGSGEILAVLGANGAGKSTTLLTISGLLPTLGGEILFDGQPV